MRENDPSRISRRDFLKMLSFFGLGTVLSRCGNGESISTESLLSPETRRSIGQMEELLEKSGTESVIVFTDNSLTDLKPIGALAGIGKEETSFQLVNSDPRRKGENSLIGSALLVAGGLAVADGPLPIGDVAGGLVVAGAAAVALHGIIKEGAELTLFSPNDHSIETRGEELANGIANIVTTAFGSEPPEDWVKKVLCSSSVIIDGMKNVTFAMVEMVTDKGMRTAVALFGQCVKTGEERLVTLLWTRQRMSGYIEKIKGRHPNLADGWCGGGPSRMLGMP